MKQYNMMPYCRFVGGKCAPSYLIQDSLTFNLLHASLGLSTEILELLQSHTRENTIEELGDFGWYMALASSLCGITMVTIPEEKLDPNLVTEKLLIEKTEAWISDVKKHVIYQKPRKLQKSLWELWDAYLKHLLRCNLSLDFIQADNMAKLQKRYAKEFTSQESEDRKDKQ